MTSYRRNFLSGGSFFFTVNLAQRRRWRLLTDPIDLLRNAFRDVRRSHRFEIDAIVVLPDHLHSVWTMPQDDADFALRWRQIKSAFSRALPAGERISESRAGKAERGIWQRRYWEHTLRDETDFARQGVARRWQSDGAQTQMTGTILPITANGEVELDYETIADVG